MASYRLDKVREMLLRELADIIPRLRDPRVGFVTVMDVEVTRDLKRATMYISVVGDDDAKREAKHHKLILSRSVEEARKSIEEELIAELEKSVEEFYSGETQENPDYTRIVNSRHHERISQLMEGQEIAFGGATRAEDCYIEPTVLRNVSPDSPIMQSEIFGPVLPVLRVKDVDEAIGFVNQGEKPLALYLFSADASTEERVLSSTSSGGVTVNGTIMHLANAKMPFGGVGPSGMGAYHGKHSFETFSHRKSVLRRGFRFDIKMMYPPYTKRRTEMAKKML